MTTPLCPIVLSMLAANPRRADEVARAFTGTGYGAATVSLARLADSGLVRRRVRDGRYLITHRGRAELDLQRALWRQRLACVRPA